MFYRRSGLYSRKQEIVVNTKCDVIVDGMQGQMLLQIVKLGLFYSLKQCQPSNCILSKVLSNKNSILRG